MKVSNEKQHVNTINLPLYKIFINCSSEIGVTVNKYFDIRPKDESKIKFTELIKIRNECKYSAHDNVKFMLNFLEENKIIFNKHINLFNSILCLKSYLTDDDCKNDIPLSHIYYYDLDKKTKIQTIKMMDEISYIFYHNPIFTV